MRTSWPCWLVSPLINWPVSINNYDHQCANMIINHCHWRWSSSFLDPGEPLDNRKLDASSVWKVSIFFALRQVYLWNIMCIYVNVKIVFPMGFSQVPQPTFCYLGNQTRFSLVCPWLSQIPKIALAANISQFGRSVVLFQYQPTQRN